MKRLISKNGNPVWIKFCGMRKAGDIAAAAKAGADAVGWIFVPSAWRYVTPEQAAAMLPEAENLQRVGVFVDAPIEWVRTVVQTVRLDFVQLHGDENRNYIEELQDKTAASIVKALRLRRPEDCERFAETYRRLPGIAAFLLEPYLEDAPGGAGRAFPWEWVHAGTWDKPIILAGGLTPDNVRDAVQTVSPDGLDVSSGIETNRQKDPAKMEAFIRNLRGW